MGLVVCRPEAPFNRSCVFEEWELLRQIADPSKDNWIPVYFSGSAIICLLLLWFLSFLIRYRDYTRYYIVCQLVPYSITCISRLFLDVYDRVIDDGSTGYRSYYYIYETPAQSVFRLSNKIGLTASGLNLPLGTAFFLLTNVIVANTRRLPRCGCWLAYVLFLSISLSAGTKHVFNVEGTADLSNYVSTLQQTIKVVAQIAMCAVSVMLIVILCALCCCSRPHIGQSTEPSVANAKTRMAWCIPYTIVALLPLSYGMSITDIFRYLATNRQAMYDDTFNVLYDTFFLANLIEPFLFTLAVVFLLPAYRSTLFGCQGYEVGKGTDLSDSPIMVKKVEMVSPPQLKLPAAVPLPTARPAAVPAPVGINQTVPPQLPAIAQGHYDANLVAVLTNPSAMHNLPHSVPVAATTVVPAYTTAAPALTTVVPTSSYQMVQQPLLTPLQQPMVVSQGYISQPQTMVRFASQPNLATFGTVQPSSSMPQLNMVAGQPSYYVRG